MTGRMGTVRRFGIYIPNFIYLFRPARVRPREFEWSRRVSVAVRHGYAKKRFDFRDCEEAPTAPGSPGSIGLPRILRRSMLAERR